MRAKLVGLLAFGLLAGPTAEATAVYAYTGNSFTTFYDGGTPVYPCPPVCGVTGSFTLADALPSSSSFIDRSAAVASFTFTDGLNVFDSTDATITTFYVGTGGAGLPDEWHIVLQTGSGGSAKILETDSVASQGGVPIDRSIIQEHGWGAEVRGNPGSWTVTSSSASVPEPGTLSLLGLGLAGVGCMRRRKAK